MRIISQNGLLDVPYELIAISPYSKNMATIVGTFPGNDPAKGDRIYIFGEYSTEEKAIKAMKMCREEYLNFETYGSNMFPFESPKVFQFPADDKI